MKIYLTFAVVIGSVSIIAWFALLTVLPVCVVKTVATLTRRLVTAA